MSLNDSSDIASTTNRLSLPDTDPWYATPFDDRWTIALLLDWAGKRHAQRDALWIEQHGWLTHGQIHAWAARVRGVLLANQTANTKTVACLTSDAAPWYVGIAAVMTSGLAYAALDAQAPDERNQMCMEDCGAEVILADVGLKDKAHALAAGKRRVIIIEEAQAQSSEVPAVQVAPQATAAFIFTSGSTGRPKAVVRSHRSLAHAMYCLAQNYSDTPSDTMLSPGSHGHVGALNDAISSMITGFRSLAIHVSGVDVTRIRELLTEQNVTMLTAAPSLLRILLKEIGQKKQPHQLRMVITSGEALLRSDVKLFHEVFQNVELWQNYGSTETGPMAAARYTAADANGDGPLPLRRSHLGVEIELLDDSDHAVAPGETGFVRIRSAYLSDGYLNAPPEQMARFGQDQRGRFFMIGDRGYRTKNGDLFITGRSDRQIKMHGRRLELGDVESAIVADPQWAQAVVVQTLGHAGSTTPSLVAVVQPMDALHADVLQLRTSLETRLPAAAIPRRFVIVKAMPQTATGKIDLAQVTKMATQLSEVAAIGRGGPPKGTMENWIADTWQFILGIDRPGREDRFQDLGGDSLAAIDFALALEKQFGLSASLDRIVQRQTIAGLVEELQSGAVTRREAIVRLRSDGAGPVCVMFPGVGGHAWVFAALAQAMGGSCDVLAVSLVDLLEGNTGTLKDVVRNEIFTALRDVANSRPIVIAGYSFGGVIATDTAQWLQNKGIEVGQLLLLDPSPLDSLPPRTTLREWARSARNFLRRDNKKKSPAAMQIEETVHRVTAELTKAYMDGSIQMPQVKASWLVSEEMAQKYVKSSTIFGREIRDIETQRFPASHLELLRPPGVRETARWMDARLQHFCK